MSNDSLAGTVDSALRKASGDVSLYLHIPFCEKICWYCGCNTGAANKSQRLSNYLDSLHREIAITGVRRGDRVVLWMTNCLEWVVAAQAVMRLGAAVVPVQVVS